MSAASLREALAASIAHHAKPRRRAAVRRRRVAHLGPEAKDLASQLEKECKTIADLSRSLATALAEDLPTAPTLKTRLDATRKRRDDIATRLAALES